MTTNQHYLESGERPKVKWARQVDMGMVDKDDMCADGRYGGPKFSPCTRRGALVAAAFLIFSCRVLPGGSAGLVGVALCSCVEHRTLTLTSVW